MQAPLCETEPERLAALARYDILDSPLEAQFDEIARLAARICDVPYTVINFIAEGRQWFKSEIGFGVRETPLDTSFCAHAILAEDLMMVPDTTRDARFDCNPLVTGEPRLRFYAGALLKTGDGHALGTLCVLDRRPRVLDALQTHALTVLADQVMQLLELRRELALREEMARKLDAALRAREQILAIVSHDLRSPLSTVVMTAEHLRKIADSPLELRTAERLLRASTSMRKLVGDLLDFESMDRGRLSMDFGIVSVATLLSELVAGLELEADAAGVTCALIGPADSVVRGDRSRLAQALGNLMHNALKATPAGGRITIEHGRRAGRMIIRVRDTGVGFDEATAARLFEPYRRGPGASEPGAGLGLAITSRIVEAHGGTIAASSQPGAGATFTLSLPAFTGPAAA